MASRFNRYGLRDHEYQAMVDTQKGLCAICNKVPTGKRSVLVVDHDDKIADGKMGLACRKSVRELLCDNCNKGLGHFFHNSTLLRQAAEYVTKWENNFTISSTFS